MIAGKPQEGTTEVWEAPQWPPPPPQPSMPRPPALKNCSHPAAKRGNIVPLNLNKQLRRSLEKRCCWPQPTLKPHCLRGRVGEESTSKQWRVSVRSPASSLSLPMPPPALPRNFPIFPRGGREWGFWLEWLAGMQPTSSVGYQTFRMPEHTPSPHQEETMGKLLIRPSSPLYTAPCCCASSHAAPPPTQNKESSCIWAQPHPTHQPSSGKSEHQTLESILTLSMPLIISSL